MLHFIGWLVLILVFGSLFTVMARDLGVKKVIEIYLTVVGLAALLALACFLISI